MATGQLQALLDSFEARLSTVEQTVLPGGAAAAAAAPMASGSRGLPAAGGNGDEVSPSVAAFDEYCAKCLEPFVAACGTLGGGAAAGGAVIKKAWAAQRDFLVMASNCKKPDQTVLGSKMAPLQACLKEAGDCRTRDDFENHTKAMGEAMGCVSWVMMYPPAGLPKDMVEPTIGGSDYWANKVRMQYRKTNPEQAAFCDTLKALLTGLLAYVQGNHKTGLEWNAKGGDCAAFSGGGSAPPAPPAAARAAAPARPAMGGGNNALFGELSKGLAVTSGLKKVTKDQQTWRKEFKADEAAPTPAAKAAPKPFASAKAGPKGPPKLEFMQQGMKWIVENQGSSNGVVTVEVTDKKHQVYIYGCVDATIDIKGKCKMVAIDGCKKTKVLLDDAISSVELVNCQRIQVQVRGSVPSVAVDKTDGFLCYLGKDGLETTFVTSKSSEMNVAFPKPDSDEQMEMPIPEQFVHTVKFDPKPRITSDVSDLYSH
ncbi:unnamed protein product [Ectocarpus fasciculatus]